MPWVCSGARGLPILEDETWDGDAAKAEIFAWAGWPDHPDAAKARRAFVFANSDRPELRGSYKCPFCRVEDGVLKASRPGITAALHRLPHTDVPPNVRRRGHTLLDLYQRRAGLGGRDAGSARESCMPYTIDKTTGLAYFREAFVLPASTIPAQNVAHLTEGLASREYPQLIFPMFTALRAERVTRNRTYYMEQTLRGDPNENTGMYSLIRPYPIPFIRDHATAGGVFGGEASEIYGRVVQAFMTEGALDNSKALTTVLGVADPYAIAKIMEGCWRTVSMGSRAQEAYCSLCDANLLESACEHSLADEGFYVKIGPRGWRGLEISQVTVPSDPGAIIQSTNLSAEDIRMYASDPTRECVYNLADPMRLNLLEADGAQDHETAIKLFESAGWLMQEFAAARKRHYAMSIGQEGDAVPVVPIPVGRATQDELSDDAFGLVYIETQSQKRLRRFPLHPEMTPEELAFTKVQIESALDLTPAERTVLADRLAHPDLSGGPVQVLLDAESYPRLLDVIAGLQRESALWEEACKSKGEGSPPPWLKKKGDDTDDDSDDDDDDDDDDASSKKKKKKAPKASESAEAGAQVVPPSEDGTVTALREQVVAEQVLRSKLLAQMIAKHQIAVNDSVARGKTLEQLVEVYQGRDVAVLETLYELIEPLLMQPTINPELVERVENPLGEADPPADAPEGVQESTDVDDDLLDLHFGPQSYPAGDDTPGSLDDLL